MAQSELEMTNASSSEDEQVSSEVESSCSESESESESERTPPTPPPPASAKPQSSSSSEETESESESESEADSPPNKSEKAEPNTNPVASKPIPSQNPTPKSPNLCKDDGNRKRKAAEVVEDETTESKISKTAAGGKKAPKIQRIWTERDEIVLIESLISYSEKKGKDPIANADDFYKFVNKSLSVDVNNKQMKSKIKRFKEKFRNNVDRFEQSGKVRSLSNPHEKKLFELSDKFWGGNSNRNGEADQKLKENCKHVVSGEAIVSGGVESVVHSRAGGIKIPITDEDIMNRGLELVSDAKKVEMEKKWKDLKVQELKHYLKKLELLIEQGELVVNAINKSGAK